MKEVTIMIPEPKDHEKHIDLLKEYQILSKVSNQWADNCKSLIRLANSYKLKNANIPSPDSEDLALNIKSLYCITEMFAIFLESKTDKKSIDFKNWLDKILLYCRITNYHRKNQR